MWLYSDTARLYLEFTICGGVYSCKHGSFDLKQILSKQPNPSFGSLNQLEFWAKLWKRHLNLKGISAEDEIEADRIAMSLEEIRAANLSTSFEVLNVDHRGARAVSAYLLLEEVRPRACSFAYFFFVRLECRGYVRIKKTNVLNI